MLMNSRCLILFSFIWVTLSSAYVPESRPLQQSHFRGAKLEDVFRGEQESPYALYLGKGSWDVGTENLKAFLQDYHRSYEGLVESDILGGALNKSPHRLIVMPGGESWTYLDNLKEPGAEEIRRFVREGGAYVGICAGAFYATSHREGGQATGPYGIGLLEGTAYDGTALNTDPFIEGVMTFDWDLTNSLVQGMGKTARMILYGGPSFHYTSDEAQKKNIQVLAWFEKVHEPAMITFQYGKGRVFLSGPHLEVKDEPVNASSGDHDLEWPLLSRVMDYLTE